MKSLEPSRYTVIDARYVLAGGEFFDLTAGQVLEMEKEFFDAVRSFYQGQCFLAWSTDDKTQISEKKLAEVFSYGMGVGQPLSLLAFDGVVPNCQVKSLAEARKYIRLTRYDPRPPAACASYPTFSQGYDPYYEKYILDSLTTYPDLRELHSGFQTIFDTQGKKFLNYLFTNECQGSFFVYPHRNKQGLYYGEITIMHSISSLDADADAYCHWIKALIYNFSEKFVNLNAHVGLSHREVPGYCLSFCNFDGSNGRRYAKDPSRKKIPKEDNLDFFHFFLAPEWINILSPFTSGYLKGTTNNIEGVSVEKLKHGQLSICADCSVFDYDIPQAKRVKQVLYEALFPGGRFYAPSFDERQDMAYLSPRSYWELTPVFPEEIEIYKSGILVAHKGNKIV